MHVLRDRMTARPVMSRAAALLLVVLAAASVLGCGSPATDGAARASSTAPASSTSAASPTVTPLATSTPVSTPTRTPTPAPTAAPTATLPVIAPPPPVATAPRPAPETHTVGMVGVAFGADLTIEAGSIVVWVNRDPVDHDISAMDSSWSSPVVRPGESFQRRFDQPGVFRYVCTLHALVMQSTLTVR